jgi:hypothetical protein
MWDGPTLEIISAIVALMLSELKGAIVLTQEYNKVRRQMVAMANLPALQAIMHCICWGCHTGGAMTWMPTLRKMLGFEQ